MNRSHVLKTRDLNVNLISHFNASTILRQKYHYKDLQLSRLKLTFGRIHFHKILTWKNCCSNIVICEIIEFIYYQR